MTGNCMRVVLFLSFIFISTSYHAALPTIHNRGGQKAQACKGVMSVNPMLSNKTPSIIVSGGGPAGLLSGILLGRRGLDVKILEKDGESGEAWTDRSYFLNLNGRVQKALQTVGLLDVVRDASFPRTGMHIHYGNGTIANKTVYNPHSLAISRPKLVGTLTHILRDQQSVQFIRNKCVTKVEPAEGSELLKVELSDGSIDYATHIVCADGKWSKVRECVAEYEKRQPQPSFTAKLTAVQSWGQRLELRHPPKDWESGPSHVVWAKTRKNTEMSVMTSIGEDKCSAWLILFNSVLDEFPELAPVDRSPSEQSDQSRDHEEQASESSTSWTSTLRHLMDNEFPALSSVLPPEAFRPDLVKRGVRHHWLDLKGSYVGMNGRVVLVGDAAHVMPPSTGEGLSTALESVIKLNDAFESMHADAKVDQVTHAFTKYGVTRPQEVEPIVRRSVNVANKRSEH